MPRPGAVRRAAPYALAAVFATSGLLHLVEPAPYVAITPRALPARDTLVTVSGLAELVCAYGLARRRRWAGGAGAALLVAAVAADPGTSQGRP